MQRHEVIVKGIIYIKTKKHSGRNYYLPLFITCVSAITMSMWDPAIYGGITFEIMVVPTACQWNGGPGCSSNQMLVLVIK